MPIGTEWLHLARRHHVLTKVKQLDNPTVTDNYPTRLWTILHHLLADPVIASVTDADHGMIFQLPETS